MNRNQMIEENMNLVYFIVRQYYPNLIHDEDVIQCGMIGLCNAVDTWDESKSAFSNYAGRCIGYAINNELKSRKRQIPTLSLEQTLTKGHDRDCSLIELIAGDSDVDYVNVQPFYDTLNPREKAVFSLLCQGLGTGDMSKKLGLSQQTISGYKRRLQILWRNYYGD